MAGGEARAVRFVRALLPDAVACRDGEVFAIVRAGRKVTLAAAVVARLVSDGVLAGDGDACRARPEATAWLRRRLLPDAPYAGQHRATVSRSDGVQVNLAESPLARLARPGGGEAFLGRAEIEAGERLRRLVERAQMQPRLTMSYSAAHTIGGRGAGRAMEVGDMAAEARRRLDAIAKALPADCYGVALDVCGFLKGLQQVEAERGWPRRSAKLVLRIALQQLAGYFGLVEEARGLEAGRARGWMDEGARPTVVG